jgi:hypothetical protein
VEAPHAVFENFGCSHLRSNTRFHVAKIPAAGKNATVLVWQAVRTYFSASFLPTFKLSKLSIVLSTSE